MGRNLVVFLIRCLGDASLVPFVGWKRVAHEEFVCSFLGFLFVRECLYLLFTENAQIDGDWGHSEVAVFGSVQETELRTTCEHSVGLGVFLGYQVIDQDSS